ncbi:hypothetical protein ERO13_A04G058126v2 [Gossypium hirsutum]|nr:hypothetical protein ERO13_A04G058126v2 [Gossypium hirsutum]
MPRSCVIDFQGSWKDYLPLVEFAYNNSFQSSIQMAPYKALYDLKVILCYVRLSWKSYADLKRRDIEYFVRDFIFLKVSHWKKILRFDRKRKLSLRFIGSYRILKRVGSVAYQLELPPELDRIHDVFHVSMLK